MSPDELAGYRGQLLALRDRLAGDVSSLADEALNSEDEAGYYVAECPALRACYTQGKTYVRVSQKPGTFREPPAWLFPAVRSRFLNSDAWIAAPPGGL